MDTKPPNTRITKGPGKRLRARIASFTFTSTEPGSRFQCKLDKGKYRTCKSKRTYRSLKVGKHVLRVRAIDRAGNVDKTPAVKRFTVPRRKR